VLWVALLARGYRAPRTWWLPVLLGLLEPALAYLADTLGLSLTSAVHGALVSGLESALVVTLAAVLLLIQPRVKSLSARPDGERSVPLTMALFAAAMYVGYFGAGGGVLLLAVLGMMIDEALTRLNALKNVISGLANFVAAVGFAVFAPVRWSFVLPLAAGFLIGGWTGPKVVRRMPPEGLRVIVALAGVGLAVRLGWSAYR